MCRLFSTKISVFIQDLSLAVDHIDLIPMVLL